MQQSNTNPLENITNEEFRWILTEHTKFLKPFPLPNTDVVAYTHQYLDKEYHQGVGVQELSALLILLIGREYVWPVVFPNNIIANPKGAGIPFFMFTNDFKNLPDEYEMGREYELVYFDINEAAKVLEN